MGAHRDRPPLVLRLRRSRRLLLYAIAIHAVALIVVLLLPIGLWRLPLLSLILLGAIHVHAVHLGGWAPWSIQTLEWHPDGAWALTLTSGERRAATLLPSTFISLPLVVLNFRVGRWGRRAVPLFADALEPDRLRRLRVLLKIEGRSGSVPVA